MTCAHWDTSRSRTESVLTTPSLQGVRHVTGSSAVPAGIHFSPLLTTSWWLLVSPLIPDQSKKAFSLFFNLLCKHTVPFCAFITWLALTASFKHSLCLSNTKIQWVHLPHLQELPPPAAHPVPLPLPLLRLCCGKSCSPTAPICCLRDLSNLFFPLVMSPHPLHKSNQMPKPLPPGQSYNP